MVLWGGSSRANGQELPRFFFTGARIGGERARGNIKKPLSKRRD